MKEFHLMVIDLYLDFEVSTSLIMKDFHFRNKRCYGNDFPYATIHEIWMLSKIP